MPVIGVVFSFVGAAVLFVIWKLMGSAESYETSYRCGAYIEAIAPITLALNIIPYAGPIAAMGWGAYLVVMASVHVHGIKPKLAWIVFGAIFAVSALGSISARRAAGNVPSGLRDLQEKYRDMNREDMTPDEAGRAAAEFLKGFEKSMNE